MCEANSELQNCFQNWLKIDNLAGINLKRCRPKISPAKLSIFDQSKFRKHFCNPHFIG